VICKQKEDESSLRKPNWACVNCGMYSSRKSSVKRHIQNIHSGNANFVSFIDYLVGRKSGLYFPGLPPTYQRKNDYKKMDSFSIMKEELLRQCVRKGVGRSSYDSLLK
jgi:hypothetical protein